MYNTCFGVFYRIHNPIKSTSEIVISSFVCVNNASYEIICFNFFILPPPFPSSLKDSTFPIDVMLAEFKKQPIAGVWKLWRSHDSTSCFQQTSDALCSRLNRRHIQRPWVHVVHQWLGRIKAIVHGGGDHSSGACFHPAAAIQTWRDAFVQVKCGELDRFFFLPKEKCFLWVLFFWNCVLCTCSLLNAAHFVGDDGLAVVEWHWGIDWDALVADAADDQATGHILHLTSEHCARTLTWALDTHRWPTV